LSSIPNRRVKIKIRSNQSKNREWFKRVWICGLNGILSGFIRLEIKVIKLNKNSNKLNYWSLDPKNMQPIKDERIMRQTQKKNVKNPKST
jgi:hypothetical protein